MRRWASDRFQRLLDVEFKGNYKLQFHLAPQLFFPRDKDTGRVRRLTIDRRLMTVLKWIRHLKLLRHSPLDLFNRTAHRRREWALVGDYETVLDELIRDQAERGNSLVSQAETEDQPIKVNDRIKEQLEALGYVD
jgi:indolepyruvate ferredoxin oxidoreductase